jgi:hypothetical protein
MSITRRRVVIVLAAVALVAVAVPAADATPTRIERPGQAPVAVPVIRSGAVGCTQAAAVLNVGVLTPTSPTSWGWAAAPPKVGVQSWQAGGWHDVPSTVTSSGLLARTAYSYRWQAYVLTDGHRVYGPVWTLPGDTCSPWVDDVAAVSSSTTNRRVAR